MTIVPTVRGYLCDRPFRPHGLAESIYYVSGMDAEQGSRTVSGVTIRLSDEEVPNECDNQNKKI
jgi:hypothetical protein